MRLDYLLNISVLCQQSIFCIFLAVIFPAFFLLILTLTNSYFFLFLGFEDYGMKNPASSLGFLRLRLRFDWLQPPLIAAIRSLCLPPSSVWLVPSSPEPHYVQTFGQRCKEWVSAQPRWIEKFFKLSG